MLHLSYPTYISINLSSLIHRTSTRKKLDYPFKLSVFLAIFAQTSQIYILFIYYIDVVCIQYTLYKNVKVEAS